MTATIAVPLLVWATWYLSPLYFSILMTIVMVLCALEWSALIGFSRPTFRILYAFIILLGIYFSKLFPIFPSLLFGLLFWFWATVEVIQFQRSRLQFGFQYQIFQAFFGCVVLLTCWLSVIYLRCGDSHSGADRFLLGLAIIFASDIGAYFSGRLWGSHYLASRVSPKKTWEGVLGGTVFALLVALSASFSLPIFRIHRISFLILSIFVAVSSVVGDLTVSVLKRQSGLKESGFLLPGHGGFLDRVDSVASGILVFALGLFLLNI